MNRAHRAAEPAPKPAASGRELALIAAVLLVCVLPFVTKPFHMDDPLFVWTAEQIRVEPWDFYGFDVNWFGWPSPMWQAMKNPPGTSYYLALVGGWFGGSEAALHLALLLPALALIWGVYGLALRFAAPPLIAALAATLSPVFLVSCTTVMCDVTMLALWVWAVLLWDRGIREESRVSLSLAAVVVGGCALTKYFGMCLIPLLAVGTLLHGRRAARRLWFLGIPLLMLACYQYATWSMYGRGLLLDAAAYATTRTAPDLAEAAARLAAGLSFCGGACASLLFLAPILLTRRLAILAGALVLVLIPLVLLDASVAHLHFEEARSAIVAPQLALWIVVGLGALALAVEDVRRERRPESVMLLLWTGGTFVFAALVNWTVNGRSLLPLVPAVAILMARHIARRKPRRWPYALPCGLVATAALAMGVAWADLGLARSAQRAAASIVDSHQGRRGRLWIQGHWGFQFYAERAGAHHLDTARPQAVAGDIMVIPTGNTNLVPPSSRRARLVGTMEVPVPSWVATMNYHAGSGFYSSIWGPVPFAFGPAKPEVYLIYEVLP
jgi:hypothetical protein